MRYLDYPFFSLDYYYWLLDYSVHYYVSYFDVVLDLFSCYDFDFFHDFLNYLLNLYDFWYSHYFLDDLLHVHWDLYNFFNYFFHRDNLLLVDDHFFNFSLDMVHDFSDSHWLFNFHDLLDDSVNCMHFRNLSDHLDYPVLDSWNFNSFLDDLLNWNDLLLTGVNDYWHLDRDWYSLLDLNYFFHLYNFLYNLLDRYDLGNLNDSIHNLLNNLLHFNNFRNDSENFKDVIDVDNIHNFLVDHTNNSLIDFKSDSCSSSQFLKFLQ